MTPFLRLCVGMGTVSAGKSMLRPLVPLYAIALGASPVLVGALVSLTFVLPLFTAMPLGRHLDRQGGLLTLRIGVVTFLVSCVWLASVPEIWALGGAQLLFGLSQLLIVLSAQALVPSMSERRSSTRSYASFSSSQSAGQLVGPALGGVVADAFGFGVAFVLAAAAGALGLAVFAILPRASGAPRARMVRDGDSDGSALAMLRNPAVQLGIVVSASVLTALTFFGSFFPLYLESLSYPATTVGLLFSARAAAALLSKVLMSQLDVVSANRAVTLIVVTTALALGVGLIGFTENVWLLLPLVLVIGACSGVSQPLSMSIVADHVPPERRGLAMGLRLTGNRGVQLVSPVLLGLAAQSFGYRTTFVLASAGLLLGAVFTLRARRSFQRLDRAYLDERA